VTDDTQAFLNAIKLNKRGAIFIPPGAQRNSMLHPLSHSFALTLHPMQLHGFFD
jgi:hypothetical protein